MNLLPLSKPMLYLLIALIVFFLFMYVMAPIRLWQISRKMDKIIGHLKDMKNK